MHGYFMSLKLYDTARLIANPFAYDEYRDKLVREKMEKMAETRIRSNKKDVGVKVNKALAEKILKEEEKAKLRAERKEKNKRKVAADFMDVDQEGAGEGEKEKEKEEVKTRSNLLSDPRFAKVFEDPAFAVDENSREYALLNPSAAAQSRDGVSKKTAVEEEEEESDRFSSDDFGRGDSGSEGESGEDDDDASSDSSAEGGSSSFFFFSLLIGA